MLSEEEKQELEDGDLFQVVFCSGFLEDKRRIEELKYLVELKKPLYVLVELGCKVPEHLIEGANIMFKLEYLASSFEEAHKTVWERIREDLGLDNLVEREVREYNPSSN